MENEQPNEAACGEIRTVMDGDAMWFVAKDVCAALGYKNHRHVLVSHLDEADVKVIPLDATRRTKGVRCISESGLYTLILSSNSSHAKNFIHWVTSCVLPAEITDGDSHGARLLSDVFSGYERPKQGQRGRPRKLPGFRDPGDENKPVKRFMNVIKDAGSIRETELFRLFPEEDKTNKRELVAYLVDVGKVSRVHDNGPDGINKVYWIVWKGGYAPSPDQPTGIVPADLKASVETLIKNRKSIREDEIARSLPGASADECSACVSSLIADGKAERLDMNPIGSDPFYVIEWRPQDEGREVGAMEKVERLIKRRGSISERDISRALPKLDLDERNSIITALMNEGKIDKRDANEGKRGRHRVLIMWKDNGKS